MVARSRHAGPPAHRLTQRMLRIRQPTNTGLVLNELEMDARAPLSVHSNRASNALLRANLGTPPRAYSAGAVTLG
jgi:hypothetical protein